MQKIKTLESTISLTREHKNKGITLIALVITIIILLILAGITIVTLTGDNGLLQKAGDAKNNTINSEIEEQIKLAYQDYQMAKYSEQGYTLQNALAKTGLDIASVEGNDSSGYEIKVNTRDGEKSFIIQVNGSTGVASSVWIDNGDGSWTKGIKTIRIGDTVYYDSGVIEYEGDGENQGKWGVLGVENGNILLMSKKNVTTVELSGKQDYLSTGSSKLNNACEPFKNEIYADSARSVKIDDINKITGHVPAEPVTYTYSMVDGKVRYNNPDDYNISRATRFEDIYGTVLTSNNSIEVTRTSYSYGLMNMGKISDLLDWNGDGFYWLDSKAVGTNVDSAYWAFYNVDYNGVTANRGLWSSDDGDNSCSEGVRAVVSLKSNIQISGNSTDGWIIQ